MMEWLGLSCFVLGVLLRPGNTQNGIDLPDTGLKCCHGDVLVLLDSSGSVSSYEFSRMLHFLSELLLPFPVGQGKVRVGLLQVGTKPHLEFGVDAHSTQPGLQRALQRITQLKGDTNTEAALSLAQGLLSRIGSEADLPKVLLWLTDGARPGMVEEPMAKLKRMGVSVLVVSMGNGNYQVLRRVVTPPIESHLHFVDIDDISIITQDLREAITELLHAECLWVEQLSSRSAVLQWRPVISANTGQYELHHRPVLPGTSSRGQGHRQILPGDASWVKLRDLQPDTSYTASLTPTSSEGNLKTLSVTFTTLPEVLSPEVVSISDSGVDRLRVSWAPVQPDQVQQYRVEYGPLPGGQVYIVTLDGYQNSTLLAGLEPDTQYLVTVSALYASGKEKSMSVKACTLEVLPALEDLQLTSVGRDTVHVQWQGHRKGLRGYWLSWEGGETQGLFHSGSSQLHLPPGAHSTVLTHVAPSTRVCVSPVYRTARGAGLCCTHKNAQV
ncbi:hypothetical protein UPYG_G00170210 [Umbra pygmaea]|uniref:von Willebrand factor A domain-containing protein 1 n=1 Tax=Umbra pygmaea TaxID=75934 RepID=A0ABD0X5G0_UMBPY